VLVALPTDDLDWVRELAWCHDAELPELRMYNDEYELRALRMYMHPELLRELGDRIQQVVIAWTELVVGSIDERLDVEGFQLPDAESGDDDLWRVWQENDLDVESGLAHIDALSMKRAYIVVGANGEDADTPIVTYESPLEVYANIDPRTRQPRAALRRWCENSGSLVRTTERYATLYLPDTTVYYEASDGSYYKETDRDEHGLGAVPVVPMVNRGRLSDRRGKSELASVLPLVHAANKMATDMMVAGEFVAIPLRGFMGAGPDVFRDENGNQLTAMQAITGKLLMVPDDGEGASPVRQFEFAAAQLANFTGVINTLAQLVASIAGLPPHYLGQVTDNPASADAIRSNEARLVKKAERRQKSFGGSHEKAMRFVRRLQEGSWDPAMRQLETMWRNAATPTIAQVADATVKLYNLPDPIVTKRQARDDLGYTPGQQRRMEQEDAIREAQQAAAFQVQTAAEQTTPAGAPGASGPAAG
jgi:hypothetical protein